MSQKRISNDEEISTGAFHLIFVNGELTFGSLSLMKVLFCWKFESLSGNLQLNWAEGFLNLVAWLHNLAEIVIVDTV